MAPFSPVSQKIWELKYRLRAPTGAPIEQSIEDTWDRVATALAEAEPALCQVRGGGAHPSGRLRYLYRLR